MSLRRQVYTCIIGSRPNALLISNFFNRCQSSQKKFYIEVKLASDFRHCRLNLLNFWIPNDSCISGKLISIIEVGIQWLFEEAADMKKY